MTKLRTVALVAGLCGSLNLCFAEDAGSHDTCQQLVPNPAVITQFYEDNPTYQDPTQNPNAWPTGTPESQGLQTSVLDQGTAALNLLPQAFSFLVIRNGVLVYEKYLHGSQMADANNVHSSSKTIIGGLVGIALREGFLKGIDQPIADILSPKFKITGKEKQGIVIKDLLTMTGGFKWTEDTTEYTIQDYPNWVQALLNLKMAANPGTKFNYDTGLTHLLSAIITESSHMSTCAFAEKYLFDPLGITVKHWGIDPQGYYSGGYNLYLTPRDLATIGQMYLQNGEWNGNSLVPADWIQESTSTGIPSDDPPSTYGYLWWLLNANGHAVHKMWGYGGQFVYVVPDLDLVFVSTANTAQDFTEMDGDTFFSQYVLPAVVSAAGK